MIKLYLYCTVVIELVVVLEETGCKIIISKGAMELFF